MRPTTPSNPGALSRKSTYIGHESSVPLPIVPPYDSSPRAWICTKASGSRIGSGRSATWSSRVKTAALAPMPSAIDTTATRLKSGARQRLRAARWRSERKRGISSGP